MRDWRSFFEKGIKIKVEVKVGITKNNLLEMKRVRSEFVRFEGNLG